MSSQNEKKRPRPLNADKKTEQKELFTGKGKTQIVADFVNDNYIVYISAHDPVKIMIECRDKNRYANPPTLTEIFLHHIDECEVTVSKTVFRDIIRSPHYIKPYDPIAAYLDSVRGKYAGSSHIDLLCSFLKFREFDSSNPTYSAERSRRIIRKWLVSAVALWVDNVPNPVMLTFIQSGEGYGKTSLVNYLIPAPLKDFSVIAVKKDNRFDLEDAYTRYPFVIHDELVPLGKGNIESWKSIMTSKELLTSRRGDETLIKRKRIANALGTSNRSQERGGFMHDTYNEGRRFGCIELEDIFWKEYIQVVDVDQIWAEAVMLYENADFDWKFDRPDFHEFAAFNAKYAIETDAIRYAHLYLTHPADQNDGEWMNASEIISDLRRNHLIRSEHLTAIVPRTMGEALTSLGFESKKVRDGSLNPLKRYHIKRMYTGNINNN